MLIKIAGYVAATVMWALCLAFCYVIVVQIWIPAVPTLAWITTLLVLEDYRQRRLTP